MGEMSKIVGLPSSTLRYYEKECLIAPNRDKNKLRIYCLRSSEVNKLFPPL
ncbi:MerR family DNA-binding transcriptional regulator [Enterococcus alcedinis]|uniref:MerR family DNA-binding transcriptional regulator n=1 Tax=Enterococcus alcedinis TaxID=1274384 RepID=UPI00227A451C|nr:MerR family DNA-binding transcriptional regulator [Enterococcus alcedinis]